MKKSDPAKAHGCDYISIKLFKICSESLTVPLKITFEQSLKEGRLSEIWKKANAVPVNKKEDKNILENYRPISLLPIFSKVFQSNRLFTSSQSSFLPSDSCTAQLLSVIHEI